ncbi:MAG: ComEA family DNA-binding protein [Pirellulaceae bacterium]
MDSHNTQNESERVEPPPTAERNPLILKRHDQMTVAALLGLALIGVVLITIWFAWSNGGMVDVDVAPRNHAEFLVDLNTAPWHEIAMLPEIGEKTARQIVAYRVSNGPFDSLTAIAMVDGIGPYTIATIRPFLAPLPASDTMVADLPGELPK